MGWSERFRRLAVLAATVGALLVGCAPYGGPIVPDRAPHHTPEGFRNWPPIDEPGVDEIVSDRVSLAARTRRRTPPPDFALSVDEARAGWTALNGADGMMWIGHDTMLIQIAGTTVLTDPVYRGSMTPLPPFGPLRIVPPALPIEALPRIDIVVISHDHYDHFEPDTIRRIAARDRPLCLVPLGVAPRRSLGCEQTRELDWGQRATRGPLTLHFLPAQHESGRGMFDRNRTLWGSWLIESAQRRIYFAGDTGFGPHFAEIARRFAPIDVAIMPVGAYLPRSPNALLHISPDEAVRALQALNAARMVPVHWGTYALGSDAVFAPIVDLPRAAGRAGVEPGRIWMLRIGETRAL